MGAKHPVAPANPHRLTGATCCSAAYARLDFAGLLAAFQVLLGADELRLPRFELIFLRVDGLFLGVDLSLQLLGFSGLFG